MIYVSIHQISNLKASKKANSHSFPLQSCRCARTEGVQSFQDPQPEEASSVTLTTSCSHTFAGSCD